MDFVFSSRMGICGGDIVFGRCARRGEIRVHWLGTSKWRSISHNELMKSTRVTRPQLVPYRGIVALEVGHLE